MPAFTITQKIHPISTRYVVTDRSGGEVCHVKKKKFKLKEELVLWADDSETRPFARMKARSVMDFSGTYDVLDEQEQPIGAFQRQGMKSMLRGAWTVLDTSGTTIGTLEEDSLAMALLRRVAGLPLPIGYTFRAPDGTVLGTHKRRMGLKDVYELEVDGLDERLAICIGLALDLIEGR